MRIDVIVEYTGEGILQVSPCDFEYNPGDWVSWAFKNSPPDSFGYLRFENAPALGPFHSLRSGSSSEALVGKGNTGTHTDNRFRYKALLLNRNLEEGVLATSQEAWVTQKAAGPDTTPDVTVTYQGEGQKLLVEPYTLALNRGDTALWHFKGFPEGYFATFQFEVAPGGAHPFVDFYVTPPQPGSSDTFRANGIGFGVNLDAQPTRLEYHVQVRDSDGRIVSNDDPAIDNLGPPVPPTYY